MKYYSEMLDELFDSEEELLKAEKKNVHAEKVMELSERIFNLYESIGALNNKRDELDDKLGEADAEYEELTGRSWFYDLTSEDDAIYYERTKKYKVEITSPLDLDECDKDVCCSCHKETKKSPVKNESDTSSKTNDEFSSIIEKEFPSLTRILRRYVEDL